MSKSYKPIDMEYLRYINKNSTLSTKDIQAIFGYKDGVSINDMMNRGDLPRPDADKSKGFRGHRPQSRWKASTVLACIRKLQENKH